MDDYGLSSAQAEYDRNEGPSPFIKDKRIEPPAEEADDGTV